MHVHPAAGEFAVSTKAAFKRVKSAGYPFYPQKITRLTKIPLYVMVTGIGAISSAG
jgi:hypothetical protein